MTEASVTLRRARGCLAAALLAVLLGFAGCTGIGYFWRQGHVPHGVRAPIILYAAERNFGFGPGGNETGLIVYRMTDQSARAVAKGGTAYLIAHSLPTDRDDRASYIDWRPTPIIRDDRWSTPEPGEPSAVSLSAYLNRYGFEIPVKARVAAEVDRLMRSPGAYYAYGGGGSLVIVAPRTKRVVLAYAG